MTVRRRLVRSTVFIALAAVLVLGIPLVVVETARVGTDQAFRLEREADVVGGVIDDRVEAGEPISAKQIAQHVQPGHRVSVTLDGRTLTVGAHLTGGIRSSRASSSRNAVVVASAPRSEESARVRRVWLLIILLGTGGVVLAVGLAAFQARRLSRPLERLVATSVRLGDGDFSARATRSAVPEIDAIASALDRSAEQIARLVAREREFSANVSHQMRTPLTALRLRVEELALIEDPAQREEEAAAALREADRLEATIVQLLAYAREERVGRAVRLDLSAIAADHVATWKPVFAQTGRSVRLDAAAGVRGVASRGMVGQVLDVLLENALRHGRGAVAVRVATDRQRATVTVEDQGAGVPPEGREAVFHRGASTSGGTGIGLYLARALAEADGASLRVVPGRPSCLELRLPLESGPPGPVVSAAEVAARR
ncbi:ATP-binding protein [Paraconexibacter antarcticus]|uniref:histidine kinase n=1 Tax=Paraconexibacter antarcticus TaxID=2949664 RepID=A0ABY5DSD5_9ACTN|nr:ATP-binding protein [Paraconexibacter antarcticus]UTI63856.1 ATP-binding protein [Paraconexibacter antarcticus]